MKPTRLTIFLSLSLLLSACSFSLAADLTPPPGYQPPPEAQTTVAVTENPLYPLVPPDLEKGEAIFAESCAPCHGTRGLGDGSRAVELPNPVIPIGSPEVARQVAPAEWFSVVTQGNLERFMPPFPSLSDRQRWDVVAYSLSLSAPRQSVLQGAEIFRDNCAACHGEEGRGDGPDSGELSLPDFTEQEYMANRSASVLFTAITEGIAPNMPPYGERLSESERWALADFLRSFTFAPPLTMDGGLATSVVGETPSSPQGTPQAEMAQTSEATAVSALDDSSVIGDINGLVMNASGGETPSGLEVMLHGFEQMQVVVTATTRLEEDGGFVFTDVEMPVGRAFLATVEYGGVTYGSEVAVVEGEDLTLELPIQVFESTTDTSALVVDRLHYFFEFLDESTLRVAELYIISNTGSRTLVASEEGQPVLAFQLPTQASDLEFQDGSLGGRYVQTEGGFGDTLPMRPGMGNYQLLYSYKMPYARKLELARPMDLAVNAVVILAPEDSIKIRGDAIQDDGTRDVQGVQYHMYSAGNLAPGDELRLTITGRPASDRLSLSSGSPYSLLIGLGALGVVLIVAGLWLYRRAQPAQVTIIPEGEIPAAPASDDPETIMDAILALDDLYQEGQLPEDAYLQRRAELKGRLEKALEKKS